MVCTEIEKLCGGNMYGRIGKTRIFRTLLSLVKEFALDPMIRARLRKGPGFNWGGTGQK